MQRAYPWIVFFGLLFGVLLIFGGISVSKSNKEKIAAHEARTAVTEGTVKKVYSIQSRNNKETTITGYEFRGNYTVGGTKYDFKVTDKEMNKYSIGSKLKIYYNPNDPKDYELNPDDFKINDNSISQIVVGIVAVLIVIVSTFIRFRENIFKKRKKQSSNTYTPPYYPPYNPQ